MAEDEGGERSEEATQTRREDFRKRGEVAQTRELGSALLLLTSIGLISALSKFFFNHVNEIFQFSFGPDMVAAVRSDNVASVFSFMGQKAVILVAPVILIAGVIGIASTFLQVGFLNVEDALSPNLNKINPLEGFKRMFSLRSVVEAFKAILKIILIGAVVVLVIKGQIVNLPYMVTYSVEQIFATLGDTTVRLLGAVGMTMFVLSAADYFYQRWDLEKKMRMTKQEVREEHKSREGDPIIKARIRRVQREMANKRMMEKIPKADVVITNPTHIAVVLKYDANLPAPQLVAKGADLVAEKIKQIAREHNIPIVENKPLARTIFKTLKLGQVIPRELFVAVAEVLSYVYRLRKKVIR